MPWNILTIHQQFILSKVYLYYQYLFLSKFIGMNSVASPHLLVLPKKHQYIWSLEVSRKMVLDGKDVV